jgi:SAM-dependent methyltransferase
MVDWGMGRYEQTAAELAPVAARVVSLAHLERGERVVDLATGTGNAALLAARTGALVTGLDSASRLIDVARDRAANEGVEASFVVGDIQALPFDDGSFDVALSVFGLIFAGDARRAFEEMLRVLRPSGRALFSVWVPAGPIDAMVGTFGRAVAAATGSSRNRFAWSDAASVGELAARDDLPADVAPVPAASRPLLAFLLVPGPPRAAARAPAGEPEGLVAGLDEQPHGERVAGAAAVRVDVAHALGEPGPHLLRARVGRHAQQAPAVDLGHARSVSRPGTPI